MHFLFLYSKVSFYFSFILYLISIQSICLLVLFFFSIDPNLEHARRVFLPPWQWLLPRSHVDEWNYALSSVGGLVGQLESHVRGATDTHDHRLRLAHKVLIPDNSKVFTARTCQIHMRNPLETSGPILVCPA